MPGNSVLGLRLRSRGAPGFPVAARQWVQQERDRMEYWRLLPRDRISGYGHSVDDAALGTRLPGAGHRSFWDHGRTLSLGRLVDRFLRAAAGQRHRGRNEPDPDRDLRQPPGHSRRTGAELWLLRVLDGPGHRARDAGRAANVSRLSPYGFHARRNGDIGRRHRDAGWHGVAANALGGRRPL